jgi:UDP-N-acetylmuramoylalanine--D-glutamate ligase
MKARDRITVIGAGVSGRALAVFARKLGHAVFVSEAKAVGDEAGELFRRFGVEYESGGHTERILDCDAMVLGSGVPPGCEPVSRAQEKGLRVIGEVDFLAPHLEGSLIGVTGSNGKTTTALLIGHLLKEAGFQAGVAGNVGSPLASHAGLNQEILVIELSSFQLFWAHGLHLDIAVVTNLEPDHIDWHGSVEEYYQAKAKIVGMLKSGGPLICQERDLSFLVPGVPSPAGVFPLSWEKEPAERRKESLLMKDDRAVMVSGGVERALFNYKDVRLLGRHNLENAAMSSAAFILEGGQREALAAALASFRAPSHRCELVETVDGVSFIDDSKGTNVAATIAALTSLEGDKVIILGGRGKGEDYGSLAEVVLMRSQAVVLLGEESPRIRQALESRDFKNIVEAASMSEAVSRAFQASSPGGMVLLSPACTSWDMYANFAEKGEDFQKWVKALKQESS